MAKAQISFSRKIVADELSCEPDNLFQDPDYQEEDQKRLDAWRAGEWYFVGVRAVAEIRVPYGQDWIVSHMESPGLWGIESDSDEEYFEEVYQEEKAQLIGMLESLREFEIK